MPDPDRPRRLDIWFDGRGETLRRDQPVQLPDRCLQRRDRHGH